VGEILQIMESNQVGVHPGDERSPVPVRPRDEDGRPDVRSGTPLHRRSAEDRTDGQRVVNRSGRLVNPRMLPTVSVPAPARAISEVRANNSSSASRISRRANGAP
jgi:hypothetical protein